MIWRTVFGLQALCFVQCAVGDLLVSTQNYVILLVWAFLLPTEQIPLWLFSLGWYITFILPKSTQLWQSCMLGQVVISCKILLNGHFLYLLIFFFGCTTDKSKSWDVICHVTFFSAIFVSCVVERGGTSEVWLDLYTVIFVQFIFACVFECP